MGVGSAAGAGLAAAAAATAAAAAAEVPSEVRWQVVRPAEVTEEGASRSVWTSEWKDGSGALHLRVDGEFHFDTSSAYTLTLVAKRNVTLDDALHQELIEKPFLLTARAARRHTVVPTRRGHVVGKSHYPAG